MKRTEINFLNIAFLDLISGALGAVIILYIAVPKGSVDVERKEVTSKDQIKIIKQDHLKTVSRLKNDIDSLKKALGKYRCFSINVY